MAYIIKQKYIIKAPIENLWKALTESKSIDLWGGGPAKMQSEENFEFILWGGTSMERIPKLLKKKH